MATSTPSGLPGRDYIFNIIIKDENGDPQDLTLVDGYALYAFVNDKKLIAQWSKNTIDDYLPITETDAENGEVRILLPAAKTINIDNITVYIEPAVQVVDADYGEIVLGSKDGAKFELINITSAPKTPVPDLSP